MVNLHNFIQDFVKLVHLPPIMCKITEGIYTEASIVTPIKSALKTAVDNLQSTINPSYIVDYNMSWYTNKNLTCDRTETAAESLTGV